MRAFMLPIWLLLVLLTGCAGQPTSQSTITADSYNLDRFDSFGQALEDSMASGDTALFVQRLDSDRFAERSLDSLGLRTIKPETVDAYSRIMGKALKNRFKETFSNVEAARFLRLLPDKADGPDTAVALIRIQPESGGVNYWEVYLERRESGIRIVDWFSYSLGDLASRSLGRFVLQIGVARMQPESKLAGLVEDYLAAAGSGDPRKVVDAYDRLPENFRHNSLLMLSQVQTSKQISDAAYEATLAKLEPVYSTNDDYALMLVDYYLFTREYAKAHRAVDAVAAKIGGDAALDSLHAGIGLAAEEYDSAIAYARDGIKKEADYEDNYWVLLDALVFSHNYADAVLVLNILEEGFGYAFDIDKLATLEGYETFARSDAFRGWQTAASN